WAAAVTGRNNRHRSAARVAGMGSLSARSRGPPASGRGRRRSAVPQRLYEGRRAAGIFLFMNGGPSHVDPFDPKPMLTQRNGEEPPDLVGKTREGRAQNSPSETDRSWPLSRPGVAGRGKETTASAGCDNRRRIVPLP